MSQPTRSAKPGFRLGIYVFKDAEIVDFAENWGQSDPGFLSAERVDDFELHTGGDSGRH